MIYKDQQWQVCLDGMFICSECCRQTSILFTEKIIGEVETYLKKKKKHKVSHVESQQVDEGSLAVTPKHWSRETASPKH